MIWNIRHRPRRTCALVLISYLIVFGNSGAQAQGFGEFLGGMIQLAMVQEAWNAVAPRIKICLDSKLAPDGNSVQNLIAQGIMPNHPNLQGYLAQCRQIEIAANAWRAMDANLRSCVNHQLEANNQSFRSVAEMGLGPSDAQITPLISQCRQIDAARTAWGALDPTVNACADRFLKNGGQSIDAMVQARVTPADSQVETIMSKCQAVSSQNLMKNIGCFIDGAQSRCDEFYVLESAQTSPLNSDQIITALMSGQIVGKASIEMPGAKSSRLVKLAERRKSMIADGALKKLATLLDPPNKFAYDKANDLRRKIDAERANPKFSEQDLLRLDGEATTLLAANNAELERQRIRREEMLSRGEIPVSGKGAGPTEKAARFAAYYQIFENQLRDFISGQADGPVGQRFKSLAAENFEAFRTRFFISDTKDQTTKSRHSYTCAVEGVFKVATLKSEVQQIMNAAVSAHSRDYRFILRYQETDNEATRYLIDSIRSEFVNSNYKVIARGAEDQTEVSHQFDYYLNILDISYDDAQSDVGSIGGAGGNVFENYVLKARVKLLDNNKDPVARQELANVPIINTKRLPRDAQMPKEARRNQLLPMQAKELARDIYRDINARLLTIAPPEVPPSGASTPEGQYSVTIIGVTQRDRDKLHALRNAVTKVLPGTETTVDPDGTNDKSIEIHFTHTEKFDPEDVVDAIYQAFKDNKQTFKVRYEGKNSFKGSL